MADDQHGSPPLLLALDSSTEQAGIALFDGRLTAELTWAAGREQTATLLAQVNHLLGLHHHTVQHVGAIAVATGPGTFNGLRVGLSVAKGLVLGLGVPLLGVPTLEAAALPFAPSDHVVVAVVAAGRGRLVWAAYGPGRPPPGQSWQQIAAPRNGTADDLAAHLATLEGEILVTGELNPEQEAIIAALPTATLPPPPLRGRRPAALAALGWHRWQAGEADDPATLDAIYVSR